MPRPHLVPLLRAGACAALALCVLSWASAAGAAGDHLHMRIDGVSGDGSVPSPLGKDAFPLRNLTLPLGMQEGEEDAAARSGPPKLGDLKFNMSVAAPALPLWQSALEGKVVPKASIAAVDAEGRIRYRIDLEQVVVRSFSLQSFGKQRETLVGSLGYERIRITHGDGEGATVTGWDRVRNKPWK